MCCRGDPGRAVRPGSPRSELSVFVLTPDVALTLAKAKEQSGSNKGLFENVGDGTTLAGVQSSGQPVGGCRQCVGAGQLTDSPCAAHRNDHRQGHIRCLRRGCGAGSWHRPHRVWFRQPGRRNPPVRRGLIMAAPTSSDLAEISRH